MPSYSGKFRHTDPGGAASNQGPCRVSFDEESCTVTPASGSPVAFDLGNVDGITPGDHEVELALYTGARIVLHYFGKAHDRMAGELREAWRDRTVKCLLLEDLKERGRYTGAAAGVPSEIRIYESNLAVLPDNGGAAFQWRLADVDSISFDEPEYTVTIEGAGRRLVVRKLAKKTDEFVQKLRAAREGVRERSAAALRTIFPFLDEGRLERLQLAMPEGRSVPVEALAAIHPKLPPALVARTVDETLEPYFEALRSRTTGPTMAGFKLLRDTEEEDGEFFWFFFPLRRSVAWEATTGSGRATYFFRPGDVGELTRGLALVNFRREPIYVSGDALERQPRLYRYAIGARKLPELRALRAAFLGRAIHSTLEEWTAQVEAIAT